MHAAGVGARLVVNNDAAYVQRGLLQSAWHGDLHLFWRQIDLWLPADTDVAWIPSHDKRAHWKAPAWDVDADFLRLLNSLADKACTKRLADTTEMLPCNGWQQLARSLRPARRTSMSSHALMWVGTENLVSFLLTSLVPAQFSSIFELVLTLLVCS